MSESRRRFLALAGSALLIVAAFVVRGRLDDDGDGDGSGADGDGGPPVLVCPPDLAQACEQAAGDDIEVRAEAAQVTADGLTAAGSGDTLGADLWLVPAPWVEAVREAREMANDEPVLGQATPPVARSPVLLAVWEDGRAAALESACGGAIEWRCVGEAAERAWTEVGGEASWGTVRVGLADPASDGGLAVLGSAAAGYLGRSDYASNDFDAGLLTWLRSLAATASSAQGGDPVARMLTRGPGEFAVVGALEVQARAAAGRDNVRLVVPQPAATADLVVVAVGREPDDGAAEDLARHDELLDALAAAGWRVEGRDPADGVDPELELADDDGLPPGPVLRALLDRWRELV